MPDLAIDCICSGDSATCVPDALTLAVRVSRRQTGVDPVGALRSLVFYANPFDPLAPTIDMGDPDPGIYTFDLAVADWAPNWSTIRVVLITDASLDQTRTPPFSAYDKFRAEYQILQHYVCTNVETHKTTEWVIHSYTTEPDDYIACEPSTGDLRCICFAGQAVNSVFYRSTPLGACNGCVISDGGFKPGLDDPKIDFGLATSKCLCVTGGSDDYKYDLVAGQLPCGQTLDITTGCITGEPDGTCAGTDTLTFRVFDRGGAGAPVGTTKTVGGTCTFVTPHAVRLSGGSWNASMVGKPFMIAGVTHTIASVEGPSNLTVV